MNASGGAVRGEAAGQLLNQVQANLVAGACQRSGKSLPPAVSPPAPRPLIRHAINRHLNQTSVI